MYVKKKRGRRQMINKIDYLKEQICKKELLSYQEGDYFYIMNQNNTDTFTQTSHLNKCLCT